MIHRRLLPLLFFILPVYLNWNSQLFHSFNLMKASIVFILFAFHHGKPDFRIYAPVLIFLGLNLASSISCSRTIYYLGASVIPAFLFQSINQNDPGTRRISEHCFILSSSLVSILSFAVTLHSGPNQYFDKNIVAFNLFISIFLAISSTNFAKVPAYTLLPYVLTILSGSIMGVFFSTVLVLHAQFMISIRVSTHSRLRIIFLFLLVIAFFTASLSFYYVSTSINTLKARIFVFQRTAALLSQINAWTGTGYYTSRYILEKDIVSDRGLFHMEFRLTNNNQASHTHNVILQVLLEAGIPGLFFWIAATGSVYRRSDWKGRLFLLLILAWLQLDFQLYYPSELIIVSAVLARLRNPAPEVEGKMQVS